MPPKEPTSLSHLLLSDGHAAYMIATMQSDQQNTDISAQTQVLTKIEEQNEATNVPVQNVQSRSGINLQPSALNVAVQPHSSSHTLPSSSLAHGLDHVVSNPYLAQQSGDYAMVEAFANALHDTLNKPNLELLNSEVMLPLI